MRGWGGWCGCSKVYGILCMQMAVTAAVAGYVVLTPGVAQWIAATPGMMVMATFAPIISTLPAPLHPQREGLCLFVRHPSHSRTVPPHYHSACSFLSSYTPTLMRGRWWCSADAAVLLPALTPTEPGAAGRVDAGHGAHSGCHHRSVLRTHHLPGTPWTTNAPPPPPSTS